MTLEHNGIPAHLDLISTMFKNG